MKSIISLGHEKVLNVLIEKGKAFVNNRTSLCATSLHLAVNKGHARIVQILLENGADANAPGKAGETSLHIAIGNGRSMICFQLPFFDFRS